MTLCVIEVVPPCSTATCPQKINGAVHKVGTQACSNVTRGQMDYLLTKLATLQLLLRGPQKKVL